MQLLFRPHLLLLLFLLPTSLAQSKDAEETQAGVNATSSVTEQPTTQAEDTLHALKEQIATLEADLQAKEQLLLDKCFSTSFGDAIGSVLFPLVVGIVALCVGSAWRWSLEDFTWCLIRYPLMAAGVVYYLYFLMEAADWYGEGASDKQASTPPTQAGGQAAPCEEELSK